MTKDERKRARAPKFRAKVEGKGRTIAEDVHPPTAKKHITNAQIIQALKQAGGIAADAARLLGCERSNIWNRLKKSKELQAARDEARAETLDLCESVLIECIKAKNLGAVVFYLKTQGRDRGYVERSEVAGVEGAAPIKFYIPAKAALPADDEPLATMPVKPIEVQPTKSATAEANAAAG